MNWPILSSRRQQRTHWVVVMAGREIVLALRQALPGRWFRLLTAGNPWELDQRLRIIVPSLVLLEISSSIGDPVPLLQNFHRHHPLVPLIAVLEGSCRDLAPRIAEQGTCQTLTKPLNVRQLKQAVLTELPDARLSRRIGATR